MKVNRLLKRSKMECKQFGDKERQRQTNTNCKRRNIDIETKSTHFTFMVLHTPSSTHSRFLHSEVWNPKWLYTLWSWICVRTETHSSRRWGIGSSQGVNYGIGMPTKQMSWKLHSHDIKAQNK